MVNEPYSANYAYLVQVKLCKQVTVKYRET